MSLSRSSIIAQPAIAPRAQATEQPRQVSAEQQRSLDEEPGEDEAEPDEGDDADAGGDVGGYEERGQGAENARADERSADGEAGSGG